MNPYLKYQQQQVPSWTRIDSLLALYDGAIERLEGALVAFAENNPQRAKPLLDRSVYIVGGMASGLDFRYGEMPQNLLRLYEFVVRCLRQRTADKTKAALGVLRTLAKGFMV